MKSPAISAEVFLENQAWLFNFVKKLVVDDFAAEDIVQDTFEQALKRQDGKAMDRGWLAGVARNKTLERLRKNARRRKREAFAANSAEAIVHSPSEVSELVAIVSSSLQSLPAQQQQVLLLRYMSDLSPAEVASKTGLSIEQVYRLTERGRLTAKQSLEQRYGSEWRSNCAAALGIPLVRHSTSLLPSLGVAAAVLIGAASIWLGIDYLKEPAASPILESAGLVAGLPATKPASDLPTMANRALMASPPSRLQGTPSRNSFFGVIAKVVDAEGLPQGFVDVTASWQDPNSFTWPSLNFTTGADGYAFVQLPEFVSEVSLAPKCEGFLNPSVKTVASFPANDTLISVHKGDWVQNLRAVDINGVALANILLTSWRHGTPSGRFRTNAEGKTTAFLPSAGSYQFRMADSMAHLEQSVVVDTLSIHQVVDITCASPPTDIKVRAVDSQSRATLANATFTGIASIRNQFNQIQGSQLIPMPSSEAGLIQYSGTDFDPTLTGIQIRAPGYQPVVAFIYTNTEPELVVELSPLGNFPARIELADPVRTIASAVIEKRVRAVCLPSRPQKQAALDFAIVSIDLQVDENGAFQLPQAENDVELPFKLIVTDDLGSTWEMAETKLADLMRDAGGVYVFSFQPKPQIPLTIQLLHADGTPASSSEVALLFYSREGRVRNWPITNEVGRIEFLAHAGEDIYLTCSIGTLSLRGEFQTPQQGNRFDLRIQLPALDASLYGTVLMADDSAAQFDFARSQALAPILLQVDGGASFPLRFDVGHRAESGAFRTDGVPSGEYETTLNFVDGLDISKTHATNVDPVFRFPSFAEFFFIITDIDGNPIEAASVGRTISSTPGSALGWKKQTNNSGMAQFAQRELSAEPTFVIAAAGFQPQVITTPLAGIANRLSLEKGRELAELNMGPLDITLDENTFWIVDVWGDYFDPRQGLVFEYLEQNQILLRSAPSEEFGFVEVDGSGIPTGRRVQIPVAGSPYRSDSEE